MAINEKPEQPSSGSSSSKVDQNGEREIGAFEGYTVSQARNLPYLWG